MKILMVCLGNICRSPIAEGVFRKYATDNRLNWKIDSAGTGHWHVGNPPDTRAIAAAAKYNINISFLRARVFKQKDFEEFDHIFVMDQSNLEDILSKTNHKEQKAKVKLLMDLVAPGEIQEVPDPYYGSPEDFDLVYQLSKKALDAFVKKHNL